MTETEERKVFKKKGLIVRLEGRVKREVRLLRRNGSDRVYVVETREVALLYVDCLEEVIHVILEDLDLDDVLTRLRKRIKRMQR